MADRISASWRRTAACIACRFESQRCVLPSMSEKTKVTVPVGALRLPSIIAVVLQGQGLASLQPKCPLARLLLVCEGVNVLCSPPPYCRIAYRGLNGRI